MPAFEVEPLPTADGERWSVQIADATEPASRVLFEHAPADNLRTASVAKIFALIEAAVRIASGALDPGERLDRRTAEPIADSGLWQHLTTDTLPVADVATLIGAVSDNWATNVLVDRLGLNAVQARAQALAPGGSMLLDYVRNGRTDDLPETLSRGNASDWSGLMAAAHHGAIVDPAVSRQLLSWLAAGADLSMVAGGLALDPLVDHSVGDRGLRLHHKTGTDDGLRADVGVVEGPDATIAYAVICNWPPERPSATRVAVLDAMATIGRSIAERIGAA